MSNPLFQALGKKGQPNIMTQFQGFMKEMEGKDPNVEINKLLASGRISQQQLNQAQQMARQFESMMKGFR